MWSINERLAGNPGLDVTAPTDAWLNDLIGLAAREAERDEDASTNEDDL